MNSKKSLTAPKTDATVLSGIVDQPSVCGALNITEMEVQFATCEKNKALGYLQKIYPSIKITEEMVSKLLALVGRDILRIQDPFMYGNKIAVIAGTNYKPEDRPKIDEAIAQLKENKLI